MIKLFFLVALSFNANMPVDSIGIETINGQVFVIHRVEEKETVFAISRRYRTTVDAILQHNAAAKNGLEIGQILRVPYSLPTTATVSNADAIVHKVQPRETLYSIARQYQVSTEDIKRWNNLGDNTLSIGQDLVVGKRTGSVVQPTQPQPVRVIAAKGVHEVQPGQTLFSIARQYDVSVDQIREWNSLSGNDLKVGQTLYVARPDQRTQEVTARTEAPVVRQEVQAPKNEPVATPPPVTTPPPAVVTAPSTQSTESIRISESLKSGDEIVEKGLAELIEGTEGNRKYLALHRTAPIGTILKIRNEMNNREVFVRVMGKLPDTAMTDKLIIRVSRSAYDRLGAIDPRFRVEVTYYK